MRNDMIEGPETSATIEESLSSLAQAGAAVVSDVLDECGYSVQVLDNTLYRIAGRDAAVCGPVFCVRGEVRLSLQTSVPTDAFLSLYALATAARPGSILVVETDGFRGGAVLGGMLATDLAANGCLGLVTDGFVRDSAELQALKMMVIGSGVTPVNGGRRWAVSEMGGAVSLPGQHGGRVLVNTGDYLLADDDGAVVIPQQTVVEIADFATELLQREAMLESERGMRTLAELAEARRHRFSHIEWLRIRR